MKPFIDPGMSPLLAEMRAAPAADYAAMPMPAARALFDKNAEANNLDPPPLAGVSDTSFDGLGGQRRARVYMPAGGRTDAAILYAHGGGWTFGSIESHDRLTRLLAIAAGTPVVSIDWRLAPEHPAPAGAADMLAALDAAARGAFGAPLGPHRLVLAGDSAGANVALAALVMQRSRGGPAPAAGVLFYGCFAADFDTWSHRAFGDGEWGLSTDRMRFAWARHLGRLPATDPIAAPLHADLSGLPPLHQSAAGLDPLVDDAIQLARRAAEHGVVTTLEVVPGVVHGYLRYSQRLPAARATIERAGALVRAALK
jgi:acetyl esterase